MNRYDRAAIYLLLAMPVYAWLACKLLSTLLTGDATIVSTVE